MRGVTQERKHRKRSLKLKQTWRALAVGWAAGGRPSVHLGQLMDAPAPSTSTAGAVIVAGKGQCLCVYVGVGRNRLSP